MPQDYSDLGKRVELAKISGELKLLWEADDAQTNASLMNLVIYSEEPGSLRANSDIARELTREHACRVLLVEIDRSVDEPSVETFITAHCNMSGGKKSVCCEQIAFYMTGTAYGRLTNTVFAQTASDLPLIFWWRGEFTHVFNERLTSVIERLLIDSSAFAKPAESHQTLAAAMEQQRFIVQDLAWTRTYEFRLAFAKLFDEPLAQGGLSAIDHVRIVSHPDHAASSALMLSWIATQAGWTLSGDLASGVNATSAEGQAIEITFEQSNESAALGTVALSGGDFSLTLDRATGDSLIREKLCCGDHCVEGVAPAPADTPGDLVASQLSRGGRNRLYLKVLPTFRSIL